MNAPIVHIERTDAGSLIVSSETIAEGSGVEHRAVLQMITKNLPDLEQFGAVAFETRPLPGGGNPLRVALLNEQQATLVMTYQRNTEQVKAFKLALVKAFFVMAKQIACQGVPQTLPDALRAYAAEVEAREALAATVAADAPKSVRSRWLQAQGCRLAIFPCRITVTRRRAPGTLRRWRHYRLLKAKLGPTGKRSAPCDR